MFVYDVVVVGGGFGGLAAAARLAHAGRSVLLLEGSGEWGGCAGKFDRGGYRFAAGATVGMGFEDDGVFARLFDEIEEPLPQMRSLSTIMNVYMPDRTISYYQDSEAWIEEIVRKFPAEADCGIRFFREVWAAKPLINQVTRAEVIIPPKTVTDWFRIMKLATNGAWKFTNLLTATVADRMRAAGIKPGSALEAFINGQLMDSVQTTATCCPALLGYIALNVFHLGAFYVDGGLAEIGFALERSIRKNGGETLLRKQVTSIQKQGETWAVCTRRDEWFCAKQLVFNGSVHSLAEQFADTESVLFNKMMPIKASEEKHVPSWGAFTVYAAGDDPFVEDDGVCFHQFIVDPTKPFAEGNQFLCSFSSKDDLLRAPSGKRTMTVSTHTDWKQWWDHPDASSYETMKDEYGSRILQVLQGQWTGVSNMSEHRMYGTPITFEHYTKRAQGRVGGYIPTSWRSIFEGFSPKSNAEGFWLCGDTVFPGAGTLGVVMSGMTVSSRILNK